LIRNRAAITGSSFLTMFFLGVGATIIGAAARNIGLSPYQIGLMLTVQNIGFMLSVIIAGAVGDTYQKPRILFIGSLVLALSYWTFYMKSSFLLNLLIMFFIGAGIGTYEGVTDAMLLDIHTRREGLYININHFFVTFGSLMITLYLVFLQMNWRLSLTQSAVVVVALALLGRAQDREDRCREQPRNDAVAAPGHGARPIATSKASSMMPAETHQRSGALSMTTQT